MHAMKPRNDRALALSAFCLEIESYRRTPEGRARDADAFLRFYFARATGEAPPSTASSRIFLARSGRPSSRAGACAV